MTRTRNGLGDSGVDFPEARFRTPHILSLHFRDGTPKGLIERLAADNIHVAQRLGRMRISPHVYNDEEDIDRFLASFRRLTAREPVTRPSRLLERQ